MARVTVMMSVYNGDKYLREAVDSILSQTFADFELLVIDDASTDSSPQILESYSDARIRVVRNEFNLGLTKSLNKGLALAEGAYIARMDADDISLPQRLERQVDYLNAHPECGMVACLYETIDENGNVVRIRSGWQPSSEQLHVELIFQNCFPHAVATFRADVAREIGGYDERFLRSQDMDMWFRLSRRSTVCLLPEALLKYRDTKANISNAHRGEQMECAHRIYIENMRYYLGEAASVEDLACFEGLRIYYNMPLDITSKSLQAFSRLKDEVVSRAPQCLDRSAIADGVDDYLCAASLRLLRNRWSLVMNAHFRRLLCRRVLRAARKRLGVRLGAAAQPGCLSF